MIYSIRSITIIISVLSVHKYLYIYVKIHIYIYVCAWMGSSGVSEPVGGMNIFQRNTLSIG